MRVFTTQMGFVQAPVRRPGQQCVSNALTSSGALKTRKPTSEDTRPEKLRTPQMLAFPPPLLEHLLRPSIEQKVQSPPQTIPQHVWPQSSIQRPHTSLISHHMPQDPERIAGPRSGGCVELQPVLEQIERVHGKTGYHACAKPGYRFDEGSGEPADEDAGRFRGPFERREGAGHCSGGGRDGFTVPARWSDGTYVFGYPWIVQFNWYERKRDRTKFTLWWCEANVMTV